MQTISSKRSIWRAGSWQTTVQFIWVVVVVVAALLRLVSLPYDYTALTSICEQCDPPSLSLKNLSDLQSLGLSANLYALYFLTLIILTTIIWIAVGIAIFVHRTDDRMALLAALSIVLFGLNFNATLPTMPVPLRVGVGVLESLGGVCMYTLMFVFPNGRFVPRWLVWVLLTMILIEVAQDIPASLYPEIPLSEAAVIVTELSFPLGMGLCLFGQIYRYRYVSTQAQRQQTKWVLFGMAFPLVIIVTLMTASSLIPTLNPEENTLFNFAAYTLWYVLLLCLPLSIGFAILRYRLWDIDLVISRTLVYGTLTVVIVAFYIAAVMGLSALLDLENNTVPSLIVTGLVALLFQPARERLQRVVNRLIYGDRDTPGDALARLGQRLEGTLSPDDVLPTIVTTIRDSLRIPYVGIVLKRDGQNTLVAESGEPPDALLALPLAYQGEQIGELKVAPRTRGEVFSHADWDLLENLTQQAGVAIHGVLLTTALRRSREQLVLAREEERRRLRRDLHDGLGPVLASLSQRLDVASVLVKRDPDAATALLSDLKGQVKAVLSEIRQLVYALRPPVLDQLGLLSAIHEAAMQHSSFDHLAVSVEAPECLPSLPAAVEVVAYRMVMEALTNVQRHAQARSCQIRLAIVDRRALELEIVDDGCGLPKGYSAGVGLMSIRERTTELGGEYKIERKAGGGTKLWVRLPISEE